MSTLTYDHPVVEAIHHRSWYDETGAAEKVIFAIAVDLRANEHEESAEYLLHHYGMDWTPPS